MDPNEYNRLNNIYHFESLPEGAQDLEVGTTYFFSKWGSIYYRGSSGSPRFIGTVLRRENETDIVIRLEEYLNVPVIKLPNYDAPGNRTVYYNEGDEARIQVFKDEIYRLHNVIEIIPNYVRPARRAPRAPALAPEPELIKTIEVPEEILFNDVISGNGISKVQCEKENKSYTFVFQTPNGSYIGECITLKAIEIMNLRRGSEEGNNYFRIEINGGSYDVKKPNWMNRDYTVNNIPKGRTFFLEPYKIITKFNENENEVKKQLYKLVNLNIRVKTPVQEVEEHVQEVEEEREVINNSEKRSRKNGGKRNKRNKNKKTKKRRYRR